MNLSVRVPTAAGLVVFLLASCADGAGRATPDQVDPTCDGSSEVAVTVEGVALSATLADTTVSDRFARLMPLELNLSDPMGQAFSGPLPGGPLEVADGDLLLDPSEGGVYYAPDSHTVAFYYDDLGQSVPPPGWALLAELEPAGVEVLAATGRDARVSIEHCG
ncbi:cyclophilin-like fold protein [Pseudactinotalea sp.]|uniref:cyclophilin-like fold protein n=1 Tax=Pseudactinotalea sp. TaxID=1926260 RepID=UPI003B3BA2D7